MTAGRVVLWRHGQTDWNASGRYQGQADIALNAAGREQARAAAAIVATLHPTALWSSPLERARDTAGALATLTGLVVQTDPQLMEINVGEWVGMTTQEATAADPAFGAALREGRDYRRSATGETAMETGERIAGAVRRIAGSLGPDDTVVIATHGLAARLGIARLLGLDYAQSVLLAGLRNCSWSVVEPSRDGDGWRLLSYNNVAPELAEPTAQASSTADGGEAATG